MIPLPIGAAERCRITRLHVLAFFAICLYIFTADGPSVAQSGAITLPRNLGELVLESETGVQGWVTSVTLEPHAQLKNLMTVVVTVRVEETLKGSPTNNYTFRQAVIDKRDLQQKMGYRVGQHVLLILMKPSSYGLTSPAGMEQGRFRIEQGGNGALLAANGLGNAGLFRGLDSQLQAKSLLLTTEVRAMIAKPGAGPVSLEHLKSLIRAIAAANSTK